MASTTTNYGWTVPTSSDLVKNGATAISTVGQSVDTFLFRPLAKNPFYNSAFDIWQRGTSFTANGYMADRWYGVIAGIAGRTISRVSGTGQFQYMTRIQRTAGNTATNGVDYGQSLEIADATLWAGKTVTFSFYARKGADYSAASSVLTGYIFSGTSSTETNRLTTAYPSGGVTAGTISATLTTTLQRFQTSFTFGSTVTQFAAVFSLGFVGTAGAADYVEITGVQLEESTQASPYQRQNPSIQSELAACQRYYWRAGGQNAYQVFSQGIASGTTQAVIYVPFPVNMRTIPGTIDYANQSVRDAVTFTAVTSITDAGTSSFAGLINANVSLGLIQYRPYFLQANNNTGTYLGFSSEL